MASKIVPGFVRREQQQFLQAEPEDLVTIIVSDGDEEEEYLVHRELICSCSVYFSCIINSVIDGNKDSTVTTLRLEDTDPEIFGLVARWIYTSNIESAEALTLARLWMLCAEIHMPVLQNRAMEKIRSLLRAGVWPGENLDDIKALVGYAFDENTYRLDRFPLLQKALVDHFAYLPTGALDAWMEHLPGLLLVHVTKVLNRHFNRLPMDLQGWELRQDAQYHVEVLGDPK
ncbi:hypothetical protein LZ554_004954 [Drepanopeziza brunnea f. sp. 'monogermtubi']|nr:hypothetical protein LZ554_004954 [Drepanopeziza brunnea f. sp. 'monogermtubi']